MTSSAGADSSDRSMQASNLYSQAWQHIHWLKFDTKARGYCKKTTHSYDLQLLFHGPREDMYAEKTFYLLMKVCIECNQVEVSLQALHCSVEKVVFGTASLREE